mgnify:CR=1 FL=1
MLKSDLYKLNVCFFTGNIQLPLALNINMHHVHQTDHYKVKCVAAIFNLFVYTVNLEFPRILFAQSIFQFWLFTLSTVVFPNSRILWPTPSDTPELGFLAQLNQTVLLDNCNKQWPGVYQCVSCANPAPHCYRRGLGLLYYNFRTLPINLGTSESYSVFPRTFPGRS